MYVQPFEGSLAANPLSTLAGNVDRRGAPLFDGREPAGRRRQYLPLRAALAGDGPPPRRYGELPDNGAGLQGLLGPLMGMLQQLMQMLQSLTGYGGTRRTEAALRPMAATAVARLYGNERFFQNASGSSEGDPHLSFNGSRWNIMSSQPDLLNSNSFAGGYKISTQATPPNGSGVTRNQSATVSLNNGATKVTINNDGERDNYELRSIGLRSLAAKRSVSATANRSPTITTARSSFRRKTGRAAASTTTLTANGKGVDVDVTAHDVDLGGALVNGNGPAPGPAPEPMPAIDPFNNSEF